MDRDCVDGLEISRVPRQILVLFLVETPDARTFLRNERMILSDGVVAFKRNAPGIETRVAVVAVTDVVTLQARLVEAPLRDGGVVRQEAVGMRHLDPVARVAEPLPVVALLAL